MKELVVPSRIRGKMRPEGAPTFYAINQFCSRIITMLNIFIRTMFVSNDDYDVDIDIDNDHIYQPVEADVYDQPCKNPKAHDEVHLPGLDW